MSDPIHSVPVNERLKRKDEDSRDERGRNFGRSEGGVGPHRLNKQTAVPGPLLISAGMILVQISIPIRPDRLLCERDLFLGIGPIATELSRHQSVVVRGGVAVRAVSGLAADGAGRVAASGGGGGGVWAVR